MKTVHGNSITVPGADVSSYQPNINWQILKAAGIGFVFLKCTEGLTVKDSTFQKFSLLCAQNGINHGAYHFFHPKYDGVAQAKFFIDTIGGSLAGDMPCVMDWETADNVPANHDVAQGLAFLSYVKQVTGKTPIVYGGPYFLNALGLPQTIKQNPLWIAHYGVSSPMIPDAWDTWHFWQYSDAQPVAGVSGKCDADKFNGTSSDLALYIKSTTSKQGV